jgi:sugar phosphate permease
VNVAPRKFLAPAPHVERLPETEVKRLYPRYRWRILESTFLGYAGFYLVRNNFSILSARLEEVEKLGICEHIASLAELVVQNSVAYASLAGLLLQPAD